MLQTCVMGGGCGGWGRCRLPNRPRRFQAPDPGPVAPELPRMSSASPTTEALGEWLVNLMLMVTYNMVMAEPPAGEPCWLGVAD